MRHFAVALASLALACGAPGRPQHAERPAQEAVEVLIASSDRLEDPVSSAIERAIAQELGFSARVVARAEVGGEQLVLYAMSAATHWLSSHPERDALVAAIEECERAGEDAEHNCADQVLRDHREPLLQERAMAECRARNDPGLPDLEELCLGEIDETLNYDVEAYCEAGFWMKAARAGDGWSLAPAGRLPEPCLRRVLGLRLVDLDADAREEILLEAVYSQLDPMRLVTWGHFRTLSVWHGPGPQLERSSSIVLGTYTGDVSASSELRCRHELTGGARPSLHLECCFEPVDEESEESEEPAPIDYAAWPPAVCGPTWTATYPPAERGFRECDVVATGDITLREAPEEGSRAIVERARNTVLYVIGHRGEWLEVLANEERGWVPAAQTSDECRSQE